MVVAHRLSYSMACGIFPNQGLNLCLLNWHVDSLPQSYQGSPVFSYFCIFVISVIIFPLSFLFVFIWVPSLFLLMSMAKGLSVVFIFSKTSSWLVVFLNCLFGLYLFPNVYYFLAYADLGLYLVFFF